VFVLLFIFSILTPSAIVLLNYFYGGYDFLYGLGNFGFTLPGLLIFAFEYFYSYATPLVFISSFVLFNSIMSIDFSFLAGIRITG